MAAEILGKIMRDYTLHLLISEAVLVVAHLDIVRQVAGIYQDCQEIQRPVECGSCPEAVRVDHEACHGGTEESPEV